MKKYNLTETHSKNPLYMKRLDKALLLIKSDLEEAAIIIDCINNKRQKEDEEL